MRLTEATADLDFMAQQSLDFEHIYSPNIVPKNKSRFNAETHTKARHNFIIGTLGHFPSRTYADLSLEILFCFNRMRKKITICIFGDLESIITSLYAVYKFVVYI